MVPLGVFTWAAAQPIYWHIHSTVFALRSIPALPVGSVRAGMTGPCSPHQAAAKTLV